MDITLDTQVLISPLSGATVPLREAVRNLKRHGLTGLLPRGASEGLVNQYAGDFNRSVQRRCPPTAGELLAAYYIANEAQLVDQWHDAQITARQYAARMGAVKRLVFGPKST